MDVLNPRPASQPATSVAKRGCPEPATSVAEFEALAVEIAGGRIKGGLGYPEGEVARRFGAAPDDFDFAVRRADGNLEARLDWANPILTEAPA